MNQLFNIPADGNFVVGVIPENVQAIAEQGVNTTRETYTQMSAAAKGSARLVEELVSTAQTATKAIGEKVLANVSRNADAFFAAALAMARAKTMPEAATLYTDYMQKQFVLASEQARELFDLSKIVGTQTFQSVLSKVTETRPPALNSSKPDRLRDQSVDA
jgi:hypothetical protein